MEIQIQELGEDNVSDINKVDGIFSITSHLVVRVEGNTLSYTIEDEPPHTKRYKPDDKDYTTYRDNPDKTVYLAYVNDHVAGQIILRKNWNNYAYIEDIAVDVNFRNRGIGEELLSRAKQWAKEKKMAGIMLETQTNNVAACKLYEHCGFTLGGVDTLLYRGLKSDTDEIALYWYYLFEQPTD